MPTPKVGVIIPSYGASASLVRAIESVLAQDYDNYVVIVVDDNDPDSKARQKTEEMMKAYLGNEHVVYLKHPNNLNGSAARNTGAAYTDAEYLSFLDDDDILMPTKISKQVEYLEKHTEYAGVYCWNNDNGVIVDKSYTGDLTKSILDISFSPQTSTWMIRHTAFNDMNGFDVSFRRHQDYEFLLRFFEHNSIGVVPEVLVNRIGNEINNQLYGQRLYDLKEYFFKRFGDIINKIDSTQPGYAKHVYAVHFSSAEVQLIKHGNFDMALKMYNKYAKKGGLMFWKLFFSQCFKGIFRKLKHH